MFDITHTNTHDRRVYESLFEYYPRLSKQYSVRIALKNGPVMMGCEGTVTVNGIFKNNLDIYVV